MIELPPGENASSITLHNPGDQPMYGQVRVFRWDQVDNDDRLSATQNLIASPPLMEIPPHGEQIVRLVLSGTRGSDQEQSYRLLIDELPTSDNANQNGVTIRLRYSIPVFVEPPGAPGTPALTWHLRHDGKGWWLMAANAGRRRAQISVVQLVTADGKVHDVDSGLLGYALAGRSRQWRLNLKDSVDLRAPLSIRAHINALPVKSHVATDIPP